MKVIAPRQRHDVNHDHCPIDHGSVDPPPRTPPTKKKEICVSNPKTAKILAAPDKL